PPWRRAVGGRGQSMLMRQAQSAPSHAPPASERQIRPPQQAPEAPPHASPLAPQGGWQTQSGPEQAPPPSTLLQEKLLQQSPLEAQAPPALVQVTTGRHTQLPSISQGSGGSVSSGVQDSPLQQVAPPAPQPSP